MCPAFCFSNHFPQVPEEIQMALKQMTGGPFSIRVREKQLKLHWDAIFRLSQGQKPKSMIMCFAGGAEGPRAVSPIAGRSGNWCKFHGGLFSNVDQNCPCLYSLTQQHNFSECFPLSALYLACFLKKCSRLLACSIVDNGRILETSHVSTRRRWINKIWTTT